MNNTKPQIKRVWMKDGEIVCIESKTKEINDNWLRLGYTLVTVKITPVSENSIWKQASRN